jgi:hypothetical protein
LLSLPAIISDSQPNPAPITIEPMVGTIAFIGVISLPCRMNAAMLAKP